MKRIIVACGSGVATSETVAAKLRRLLEQKGVQNVEVEAININALEKQIKRADIYVAITPFKQENFPIPVFSGMAFLTGFGQEAEIEKVDKGFMAVKVPGNQTSEIKFVYEQPGFIFGIIISATCGIIYLIYILLIIAYRIIMKKFREKRAISKLEEDNNSNTELLPENIEETHTENNIT